jgi:hypothetical protein
MLRCLCLILVVTSQPACESCEFSFGTIPVSGRLTIKGPVPPEIVVRTCTGPRADDCGSTGFVQQDAADARTFQVELEPEGTATCGWNKRWLVITAPGCEPFAQEVITAGDIDEGLAQSAMLDLAHYDVVLTCGQSSAVPAST